MKRLLMLSIVLASVVSCSKDVTTMKEEVKVLQAIGCVCKDGTIIQGSGLFPYTANTKLNVVVDTSECSKVRIGEIWERYYQISQYVWSVYGEVRQVGTYKYTYGGFNYYLLNTTDNVNRILTTTKKNYTITIDTATKYTPNYVGSSSCKGKRTTSVQCSGTTLSGNRCKNNTLSCNGRCYLHGGN